jgi:hypothetical protein
VAEKIVEVDGSGGRPLVAEFDVRELAVRLFEAAYEIKRPEGATLEEAIARIKQVPSEPDMWESLLRMSDRALDYLAEGIQAAKPFDREKMQ